MAIKTDNHFKTVQFFGLTFAISWICWILLPRFTSLPQPAVLTAGTFGPTLAALLLTATYQGRAGLKNLLKKLLIWKVSAKWYLISFFGAAVVVFISLQIHKLTGGTVNQINDPRQWYLVFPGFLQVLLLSVAGEELGWRGYALPGLLKRSHSLNASIILGFVWGAWHVPLWSMPGNFHTEIPLAAFILHDVALSILMTWMYNHTRHSLLIPHIFHTAVNLTIGVAPILPEGTGGSRLPLAYAFGILWLCAILVVVKEGPDLGKNKR